MSLLYLSSLLDVLVNILVAFVFISVIAVVLYGGGGGGGEGYGKGRMCGRGGEGADDGMVVQMRRGRG